MSTKKSELNQKYSINGKTNGRQGQSIRLKETVRAWLYDRVMTGLTSGWYHHVLTRLPDGARLLDVGIGTGGAVSRNADLVRAKNIRVRGIDIDNAYLSQCDKICAQRGLTDYIETQRSSVYDHDDGPYDAVYFSASFMLLSDPLKAIRQVCTQLAPHGVIFFTQTFHHDRSALMERIKPMLHRFTTIHFGAVTYEDEFRNLLMEGGLELVEWITMGRTSNSSFQLAMARPVITAAPAVSMVDIAPPLEKVFLAMR